MIINLSGSELRGQTGMFHVTGLAGQGKQGPSYFCYCMECSAEQVQLGERLTFGSACCKSTSHDGVVLRKQAVEQENQRAAESRRQSRLKEERQRTEYAARVQANALQGEERARHRWVTQSNWVLANLPDEHEQFFTLFPFDNYKLGGTSHWDKVHAWYENRLSLTNQYQECLTYADDARQDFLVRKRAWFDMPEADRSKLLQFVRGEKTATELMQLV